MGAAAELGYAIMGDPNGGNQTGFTVAQMTVSDGERLTTSKAFLYPAEVLSRPNLNIIARAQVWETCQYRTYSHFCKTTVQEWSQLKSCI